MTTQRRLITYDELHNYTNESGSWPVAADLDLEFLQLPGAERLVAQEVLAELGSGGEDGGVWCCTARFFNFCSEVTYSEIEQALQPWIRDTATTVTGEVVVAAWPGRVCFSYRGQCLSELCRSQLLAEWSRVYDLLRKNHTIQQVFFVGDVKYRRARFCQAQSSANTMVAAMDQWIKDYHVVYESAPSVTDMLESIGCYFLNFAQEYHENQLLHLMKGTVIND